MTEPTVDAERIAALLDGRLDATNRAEVLARLTASAEDFETFVEAAAVLGDLDRDAPGAVARPRLRGGAEHWRVPRKRWLAAAVAVAGIAAASLLWVQSHSTAPADPGQFALLLHDQRAGLTPAWEGRPWIQTRGTDEPMSAASRAARLGSRLTDLDVTLTARDSSAAGIAIDIATLLDPMPGAAPLALFYRTAARDIADAHWPTPAEIALHRQSVAQLAGTDVVTLGALAEAGRIAAARHDQAFFDARATRDALDRASTSNATPPNARAPVQRARAVTSAARPPNWSALGDAFTSLLASLGI